MKAGSPIALSRSRLSSTASKRSSSCSLSSKAAMVLLLKGNAHSSNVSSSVSAFESQ